MPIPRIERVKCMDIDETMKIPRLSKLRLASSHCIYQYFLRYQFMKPKGFHTYVRTRLAMADYTRQQKLVKKNPLLDIIVHFTWTI